MTDQALTPLRRRMIEDMTIRKLAPKTQSSYIRAVRNFTVCLDRSPDQASAEDLRRYQLHLASSGVATPSLNATVTISMAVMVLWRWAAGRGVQAAVQIDNPFEFWSAVRFGLLLAAVMILARALPVWLGTSGYDLLALASGIGDVDAITLSMARLANAGITIESAARAIVIAVIANSVAKIVMTLVAGNRLMAGSFAAIIGLGIGVAALTAFLRQG